MTTVFQSGSAWTTELAIDYFSENRNLDVPTQSDSQWDEWELLEAIEPGIQSVSGEQLRIAREANLGAWEFAIFEAIWYGFGQERTKEILAQRAFGIFLERNPNRAWSAIEKCFDEGFVQFLTPDFLDRMWQELLNSGYLVLNDAVENCVSRDDAIGRISFTEKGADFYRRWLGGVKHHLAAGPDEQDGWKVAYGTTIEECEREVYSEYDLNDGIETTAMDPPVKIGRWCDCWWRRFESGYRIRYQHFRKE